MDLEAGFSAVDGGFDLHFAGRLVLRHRPDAPVLDSASGNPSVLMYRGNFKIEDAPQAQVTPLASAVEGAAVTLSHNDAAVARLGRSIDRVLSGARMEAPSPIFGPLTHAEWMALQCRHSELHLSFLHPR